MFFSHWDRTYRAVLRCGSASVCSTACYGLQGRQDVAADLYTCHRLLIEAAGELGHQPVQLEQGLSLSLMELGDKAIVGLRMVQWPRRQRRQQTGLGTKAPAYPGHTAERRVRVVLVPAAIAEPQANPAGDDVGQVQVEPTSPTAGTFEQRIVIAERAGLVVKLHPGLPAGSADDDARGFSPDRGDEGVPLPVGFRPEHECPIPMEPVDVEGGNVF